MAVHIVVNTNAEKFRRRAELLPKVRAAALDAPVWPTRTLAELADVAERVVDSDPSPLVVLCGGDGTFMAGVTAFDEARAARRLPQFVFAPGGTVATTARNFGHRASLLATVKRATSAPQSLATQSRASLRVTERDGSRRIGFIFGTGLVARFFVEYYAAGAGGTKTAARLVARIFVGSFTTSELATKVLDPLACRLEVDGQVLPAAGYSLIVSSVMRDLGLHMRVTHRGGERAERPHLVASPLRSRHLGPQCWRVLLGRPLVGPGNFDDLVGKFAVDFGERPGPYVLDGDLLKSERVEVSAGPELEIATF